VEKIFVTIYYFIMVLFSLCSRGDNPSKWAEKSAERFKEYITPYVYGYKDPIKKVDFIRFPLFLYEEISGDNKPSKLINEYPDVENIYVDKLVAIGVLHTEEKMFYPNNSINGQEMIDLTYKAISIALNKHQIDHAKLNKDDLLTIFKKLKKGKLKIDKPIKAQEAVAFYVDTIDLFNEAYKTENIRILTRVESAQQENERRKNSE